ncbi:MAG: DUF3662 and FHA domain-containing protein [Geodermatophilaceae bacterium]|nr:DUF3662 and FHA domain-containing protein [Geodermatophilaceae bacterium]
MGVLQRFERRLEGVVGGAFARLFKGKVHPAEIGRALQREADEQKVVVGEGRVLVPNRYTVTLGEIDYAHLGEWEQQLTSTLAQLLHEQIDQEGWSTFGYVSVAFECDKNLHTGVFDVRSRVDPDAPGQRPRLPEAPARPVAQNGSAAAVQAPAPPALPPGPPLKAATLQHSLVVDGPNTRYCLGEGSNVIGRSQDAIVRLPDTGVSRRHVDITVQGDTAVAHDLGSTNGSIVNGQRIAAQQLRDGDVIRIGHSVLVYRLDGG